MNIIKRTTIYHSLMKLVVSLIIDIENIIENKEAINEATLFNNSSGNLCLPNSNNVFVVFISMFLFVSESKYNAFFEYIKIIYNKNAKIF